MKYNKKNYFKTWSENEIRRKNSEYWKSILFCSVENALCYPTDPQTFSFKTSDHGRMLVRLHDEHSVRLTDDKG
jgi:hypothetical protein